MSDTLTRIRAVVADHAGVDTEKVGDDQLFGAAEAEGGLGFDSLDRIELAIKVGEAFGVDIPDEDVDKPELGTAAGLAAYVDALSR